jgi:uncharacterized protein YdbL (DUF1318 family)
MRRVLPLKILLASLLVAACVTINVYFPAAAADKAADETIDKILKGSGTTTPPQGYLMTSPDSNNDVVVLAVARLLDVVIPAAHAQGDETLDISSPAITRITQSLAQRFGELEKFFASGAVGLTNNGNVEVRDLNAVALPDRATVKRLVAEDNTDRARLYTEMARANNHPEWEADIRKRFALRWVAKAKSGWYYQDDSGAWKQK